MLTVEEINNMLERLDRQYQSDRETLLRMRELMSRASVITPAESKPAKPTTPPHNLPPRRPVSKASGGGRSNRDIIREFVTRAQEPFTMQDLMKAAKLSGDNAAAALGPNVWSSTLSHLKELGHIEMVKEGAGNIPAAYKLAVPPSELLNPEKNRSSRPSPLQDLVLAAVASIRAITFDRTELYDHFTGSNPELRDRYRLDVVGAVLNRLANRNRGVRIISRSATGNHYEKIQ